MSKYKSGSFFATVLTRLGILESATSFDGDYNNLDNIPSSFPPSTHTHDDRYYTEGEVDTSLAGKVDKIVGKGLSEVDFTSTKDTKLSGIATGATANDTDANLRARENHTGTQAISTITDLQTELTSLSSRITTLENWKSALKISKLEIFEATTDANGDFSVTTSTEFTSPKVLITPVVTAGAEGYHAHVTSISGTTINGRAFKNKTQGVLIGGTIDPDNPVNSTKINVVVFQAV